MIGYFINLIISQQYIYVDKMTCIVPGSIFERNVKNVKIHKKGLGHLTIAILIFIVSSFSNRLSWLGEFKLETHEHGTTVLEIVAEVRALYVISSSGS
jgi:hypothetical protein